MQNRDVAPELFELARPIPARLIEAAPTGKTGSYVPHFVINQVLLATIGPFDWELVEVLRGRVPEHTSQSNSWPALELAVVGAVYRMTATIDGEKVIIEEVGECDAGAWEPNDAMRLKKAASDAIKRCAMRLGVAIHLWCKRPDQFILAKALAVGGDTDPDPVVGVEEQQAVSVTSDQPLPADETPGADPDEIAEVIELDTAGDLITQARAFDALEHELNRPLEGRVKCQGKCERLEASTENHSCCLDAHLRRLYAAGTDAGLVQGDDDGRDALHAALRSAGKHHVGDFRKAELLVFIDMSRHMLYDLLYAREDGLR